MTIEYTSERVISVEQYVDVLKRSTLAERRPVNEAESIKKMLQHADLLCSAWAGDKLVGIARSLTDFAFCCYLSDLAVDTDFQGQGIGKELIRQTQRKLGSQCKIILLAAPKAESYYPQIGFTQHRSAWVIDASKAI